VHELGGREQRWCDGDAHICWGGGMGEAATGAWASASTGLRWVAHHGAGRRWEKRATTVTWLGCGGSPASAGDRMAARVLDSAGGDPRAARR
jgi:hypothetical protein